MAVRNFWVDAYIDGRATELSGGPRAKDGGMCVSIKQRSEGAITNALKIKCREVNDSLVMEVFDNYGELIHTFETER